MTPDLVLRGSAMPSVGGLKVKHQLRVVSRVLLTMSRIKLRSTRFRGRDPQSPTAEHEAKVWLLSSKTERRIVVDMVSSHSAVVLVTCKDRKVPVAS